MLIVIIMALLVLLNWVVMTLLADRQLRGWIAFLVGLIFLSAVIALIYQGSIYPLRISVSSALTQSAGPQ